MSKKQEQKVTKILYVVLLVIASILLISPFFIAIILAATVALAMWPLQLKLEAKGIQRKRAAGMLTALFAILISVPFLFFIVKGTIAVTNKLEKISASDKLEQHGVQDLVKNMRHDFVDNIHKYVSKHEWASFMDEQKINFYLQTVNDFLLKFFQKFLVSLPLVFLLLLIMVLCLFSFLKHAEEIKNFFQDLFGFSSERMNQLIKIFIEDSRQVYISNIVTGGFQSFLVASGVALLGLGDFFLVFFVTLILSFIPIIGAAPVTFVFALLAFFRDNNTAAIILVVLGSITGVIDNILRPWLASLGETKSPPMVSFICVLGGALLLGFPGLFIGILIGSIAYDTLPIFWTEIAKQNNHSD